MRRIRRAVAIAGHLIAFYLVARWLEDQVDQVLELMDESRRVAARIRW